MSLHYAQDSGEQMTAALAGTIPGTVYFLDECKAFGGVPTGGFVPVSDALFSMGNDPVRAYTVRMLMEELPVSEYTIGVSYLGHTILRSVRSLDKLDSIFVAPCVFEAARRTFEPTVAQSNVRKRLNPSVTAAAAIRALLPNWADARVAALFGVSRQAWRDWVAGTAIPRSNRRRRLYRLHRILELRKAVAPGDDLEAWLEQPIDLRSGRTAEDALRAGDDEIVAVLAARKPNATRVAPYRLGSADTDEPV